MNPVRESHTLYPSKAVKAEITCDYLINSSLMIVEVEFKLEVATVLARYGTKHPAITLYSRWRTYIDSAIELVSPQP